jgi:dihydrofolate reductase
MGRKTYFSIGSSPGRETVLTRDPIRAEGVHVAHSLDQAFSDGQRLGLRWVPILSSWPVVPTHAQALPLADG